MISLTRLSGTSFLLNADLIERVDSTPDTVVTLVDGTKYVVSEGPDVVLAEVVDYRARIVARAPLFEHGPLGPGGTGAGSHLSAVPSTAVPTTAGRRASSQRNRGGDS
ncbi:flagellar protein FlbD [Nocardioides sp. GY 10113]|uniref:flagellar FlbD family protein n=1 Tax=Nocardioides sp. GY 10113 TaxID=2569761 RepID=UPI0010A92F92|nr:flagellar FlbD family protein [Nocardioides sp. GY 10113]TIC83528.1 flagellar protein FlbD [Nocardioides sp. GY 10113]